VTAPEETLGALDELVREGKVRDIAASNVSPERLEAAMDASARPTVVAPIASARTPEQLAELMTMADLEPSADELRALDAASA
jgi:aryl-alcohol dehydrogenase-like predicted oxidoreductase